LCCARSCLRYCIALFLAFWARESLLALPVCSFGEFSGTRGRSCVTVLIFWAVFRHARTLLGYRFDLLESFRHARGFLRYHFARLGSFRARERLLALPFCSFGEFSGTREASCEHVSPLLTRFRVHKNLLRTRFPPFDPLSRPQDPLANTFSPF
jgi:hypothetical protein